MGQSLENGVPCYYSNSESPTIHGDKWGTVRRLDRAPGRTRVLERLFQSDIYKTILRQSKRGFRSCVTNKSKNGIRIQIGGPRIDHLA